MNNIFSITCEGYDPVVKNLRNLPFKITPKLKRSMHVLTSRGASHTRRKMRGWIWDTGRLANSLSNKVTTSKSGITGYIYTSVYYGKYVHFGTSKMRNRPFMDVALEYIMTNAAKSFRRIF